MNQATGKVIQKIDDDFANAITDVLYNAKQNFKGTNKMWQEYQNAIVNDMFEKASKIDPDIGAGKSWKELFKNTDNNITPNVDEIIGRTSFTKLKNTLESTNPTLFNKINNLSSDAQKNFYNSYGAFVNKSFGKSGGSLENINDMFSYLGEFAMKDAKPDDILARMKLIGINKFSTSGKTFGKRYFDGTKVENASNKIDEINQKLGIKLENIDNVNDLFRIIKQRDLSPEYLRNFVEDVKTNLDFFEMPYDFRRKINAIDNVAKGRSIERDTFTMLDEDLFDGFFGNQLSGRNVAREQASIFKKQTSQIDNLPKLDEINNSSSIGENIKIIEDTSKELSDMKYLIQSRTKNLTGPEKKLIKDIDDKINSLDKLEGQYNRRKLELELKEEERLKAEAEEERLKAEAEEERLKAEAEEERLKAEAEEERLKAEAEEERLKLKLKKKD